MGASFLVFRTKNQFKISNITLQFAILEQIDNLLNKASKLFLLSRKKSIVVCSLGLDDTVYNVIIFHYYFVATEMNISTHACRMYYLLKVRK